MILIIDFKSNAGEKFIKYFFDKIKLILMSNQYTTEKNTEKEAIFSNCGFHDYFLYSTTYSHHFNIVTEIAYINFS